MKVSFAFRGRFRFRFRCGRSSALQIRNTTQIFNPVLDSDGESNNLFIRFSVFVFYPGNMRPLRAEKHRTPTCTYMYNLTEECFLGILGIFPIFFREKPKNFTAPNSRLEIFRYPLLF